jgi:hypothetical protein
MFTKKISLMHSTTVLWQETASRRILWFTFLMYQNSDGYVELTKEQLFTQSNLSEIEFNDAYNFLLGLNDTSDLQFIIQKNRGYQINCSDRTKRTFSFHAPLWKQNTAEGYEEYLRIAEDAFTEITHDNEWLLKMKRNFPNVHILKTIERAFDTYWGTRAGWENKRRKKIRSINWRTTIDKTFKFSAVYVQKNEYDNELEYFKANLSNKGSNQ